LSRDFPAIEKAFSQSQSEQSQSSVTNLPPGYIQGFTITLRKDYTVLITGGQANVGGLGVIMADDHQLTKDDWVAPRMNTPQHYYIYLAKTGHIYVDIVRPRFNSSFGYPEQVDYGWRCIGKLFVRDTDIIYAVGPDRGI
jgi:hypothetical protein